MNAKHGAFVTEYVRDFNAARAAQAVGYSPRSAGALLARPDIAEAIAKTQEAAAAEARVTLQSLLDEAEAARRVAQDANNASGMVSATTLKAKLTGRLVDSAAEASERERLEIDARRDNELKSTARLLSEAAASLGLPADATPAMIVGASAERAIATPEVYRLMRGVVTDAA